MMELKVALKMIFGLILLVGMLVVLGGCGGEGGDSGGSGESANRAPEVSVGSEAVESAQVGGESKYFMKEDLSRHTFLVKYVSEQNNVLSKEGAEPKSIKEEGFEVVLRMSPAGAEEEGQLKLRLETEQIVLELFGVKIESESLVGPLAVEKAPELGDIHRAMQMLAGMSYEVWVDTSTNYKVMNVMREERLAKIEAESDVFKQYFEFYRGVIEKEAAGGLVMLAGDYLPGKEVEVGQKWDIGVVAGGEESELLPIQKQCRLDEVIREGDQELARVSFAIGYQSSREREMSFEGQSARAKKMLMDGGGEVVFNLSEDFARDFSMKYKNTVDLLFEDESKGVVTMEQEIVLHKEIVK